MTVIRYKLYDEIEMHNIYLEVTEIEGEWIATTNGGPICQTICEEADDLGTIAQIERIMTGDTSECEVCDTYKAEDYEIEYIENALKAWGIR